jgi:hypothetical protein
MEVVRAVEVMVRAQVVVLRKSRAGGGDDVCLGWKWKAIWAERKVVASG